MELRAADIAAHLAGVKQPETLADRLTRYCPTSLANKIRHDLARDPKATTHSLVQMCRASYVATTYGVSPNLSTA